MTKLQKERHAEGSAADGAAGVVISANGPDENAVATNYSKLAAGGFIALASYFGLYVVAQSEPETATVVIAVMLVIPY